jgi:hypothetical protein
VALSGRKQACLQGVASDGLRNTLAITDAAVWAGVIMPEGLPTIATDLLAHGEDSPHLRTLAGLDLEPFDPRDAREMFDEVLAEHAVTPADQGWRVQAAAHLIATVLVANVMTVDRALDLFTHLANVAGYTDDPDVIRLCSLEDELRGRRGRSRGEIESEARELAAVIARRDKPPSVVLMEAVAFTS